MHYSSDDTSRTSKGLRRFGLLGLGFYIIMVTAGCSSSSNSGVSSSPTVTFRSTTTVYDGGLSYPAGVSAGLSMTIEVIMNNPEPSVAEKSWDYKDVLRITVSVSNSYSAVVEASKFNWERTDGVFETNDAGQFIAAPDFWHLSQIAGGTGTDSNGELINYLIFDENLELDLNPSYFYSDTTEANRLLHLPNGWTIVEP